MVKLEVLTAQLFDRSQTLFGRLRQPVGRVGLVCGFERAEEDHATSHAPRVALGLERAEAGQRLEPCAVRAARRLGS
jgi:hypothetical protein